MWEWKHHKLQILRKKDWNTAAAERKLEIAGVDSKRKMQAKKQEEEEKRKKENQTHLTPMRSRASTTMTSNKPSLTSRLAHVSPATPAPTITTFGR